MKFTPEMLINRLFGTSGPAQNILSSILHGSPSELKKVEQAHSILLNRGKYVFEFICKQVFLIL